MIGRRGNGMVRRSALLGVAAATACLAVWVAEAGWSAVSTAPGSDGVILFSRLEPPCPGGHCKDVIATMRSDGSGEQHLTRGPIDVNPVWSPNGRRIAFIREHAVSPGPQLWVMNANGSGLKLLAGHLAGINPNSPGGVPIPDWLDNQRIVFDAQSVHGCGARGYIHCLAVVSRRGGRVRRLLRLPASASAWAIRGSTIAYVKFPEGLYVENVKGSGRRLVTAGPRPNGHFAFDQEGGGRIDWSPDGRKVVFATNQFIDDSGTADLYTVDAQTGALQLIPGKPWLPPSGSTMPSGVITAPSWSPDGTKIIFNIDYSGHSGFMIIPAAGGMNSGVWITGRPKRCTGGGEEGEICSGWFARWQPKH